MDITKSTLSKFMPLLLLIMFLIISIAFINNPIRISYNFHIAVFILGFCSTLSRSKLMNRWIIPSVLLLASLVYFILNPAHLIGLERIIKAILLLPIASIGLYFLGHFIGSLVHKKFPLVPLAILVFVFYLAFLFIVQNHVLAISFWVVFSFIVSLFLKKENLSMLQILGVLSLYPINMIVTFLFSANDIFWDIGIPSFIAISIGMISGIYLVKREMINPLSISSVVFLLLLGIFGLPILSNNIFTTTSISQEELKIEDVPFIYKGDTISLRSFEGKVLVLDFWNSRCAACFKLFPDFEKLKNKFHEREDMVFFAINSPTGREKPGDAASIMDQLEYSFESLYLLSPDAFRDFGVQYFPTLVIINKDQTEILRMSIELSPLVVNNSPKMIETFLD